jgi:hypothetical protein
LPDVPGEDDEEEMTDEQGRGEKMNTPDILIIGLTVFGAIEMSYVESVILLPPDGTTAHTKSLREIYWRDLSWKHRLLFWTGAICLLSSFTVSLLPRAGY